MGDAVDAQTRREFAVKAKNATDKFEKLRYSCLKRGSSGIKGLGRVFRIMDDDGSKALNFEEFKKGIHDYGLTDFNEQDCREMFEKCDKDKSGSLSFDEFLTSLRGPMSQSRKDIIGKAFEKLDKTGDGVVTIKDLKRVYNAREHKKYKSGEWTENEVFKEFLNTFDSENDRDDKITREEFENYYVGISASCDTDAYFDCMMRNAWKL